MILITKIFLLNKRASIKKQLRYVIKTFKTEEQRKLSYLHAFYMKMILLTRIKLIIIIIYYNLLKLQAVTLRERQYKSIRR